MAARAHITDRALRYRANRLIPNHAKVCAFCGQKNSAVEVGHVNGDESDETPENLTWTCRSCNVVAGNTLRSFGIGRLTHQYNPSPVIGGRPLGRDYQSAIKRAEKTDALNAQIARTTSPAKLLKLYRQRDAVSKDAAGEFHSNPSASGGASNVGEWIQAVGAITPHTDRGDRGLASTMSVSEALAMIRATPHSKRSQFAAQLRKHQGSRARERYNPSWTGDEDDLIQQAKTARTAAELGRLFRYAEKHDIPSLKDAVRDRVKQLGLKPKDFQENPSAKKNFWPFSDARTHGEIPARGGIAAHSPTKKAVRLSSTSYRGYKIGRTEDGEWFSALDPDSWYESSAQLKRAIDSHAKGRSNPGAFARCVKEVKRNPVSLVPLGLYDLAALDAAGKGIFKKLHNGRQRNPMDAATEQYESFHGRPSEKIVEIVEDVHYHSALAQLGALRQLRVKAADGEMVYLANFGADCLLCSNEDGTQLYIRGGDQEVDLEQFGIDSPHDFEDLGEVKQIRYYTTKDHLGSEGGEAEYYHNFGEEDVERGEKARRPRLRYSTRDKLLSFVGGAYEVKPEGIAN